MKIKTIVIIVIIVGILAAVKFYLLPSKQSSANASSGQQNKASSVAVTTYIVKTEKLDNAVYASGTVLANEEVELKPEIAGKIIQLNITEGGAVTKGQLLVKINDAEFQAQFKKIQIEKSLAETQLAREKELLKINGISQQDVDISENKVNSLKADMEYLQSQIAKTEVHAPFNGWIGLKNVSEGAYVTPTTVIANIQQTNPVKLDFFVSERYSDQIKKGNKVLFTIEGSKKSLTGEVFAIEPKIDLATLTLKVRAICPNSQGTIYPGAFARVQVQLGSIDDAIMIPTESIIPDLKGKKVFRLKNGIADYVRVETGLRTDAQIQVTEGLVTGDTIIKTGIMQLKPGMPVKITD